MLPLRDRLTRAPVVFDPGRAEAATSPLDASLRGGAMGELLAGACGSSPYLARLVKRYGGWLVEAVAEPPEAAVQSLLQDLERACGPDAAQRDVGVALRQTKSRVALLAALADLGGVWTLSEVTGALSRMADTAVTTASMWLLGRELAHGRLPGLSADAAAHGAGYVILAMGKLGAAELNYSSDIDLIALFDDSLFPDRDLPDARARYVHVTKQLVSLLSENTADGYTFRTDLRLRPSPSTTPVCMSMTAAERYYETAGRTWERAAHIKARPLVDLAAGAAYLERLSPFVWRRHLDFAAIEDVHSLLRKIRAQNARFTPEGLAGYNLKLGPGGIREIEFFAQTRQLIMGGRDPSLRLRATLAALSALADADIIEAESRDALTADYMRLRTLEHRLQMIEDAQTHAIPASPEGRARVAALAGETDAIKFEKDLAELLARVHRACEGFFGQREAPGADTAPPISAEHFEISGFERPEDALRMVSRWTAGEIPATRSERAQRLLGGLETLVIDRLSGAADPDRALVQFDRFLSGLPSGVQVFSLFSANPQLLDLIVEICSAAPRLAAYLARHPQTLDALLDRHFWQPPPGRKALAADLATRLEGIGDYERALDAARRWAREHWFQIGVHVLRNIASPEEAGAGFSDIAETYIAGLLPWVIRDFAARHGPPPGDGLAVLAFGKLGSREMTAGSDLDLITIYDDAGAEMSDGPKPLMSSVYYRRLTQALVLALTAQTAEGAVYEVDMRLRPSGRSGPVAVPLAGFERYQMEDAWVWEHMALTRARALAGPAPLCAKVADIAARALASRRGDPRVRTEAREMRARLKDAHASDRNNAWSLKHAAGGLMEIEFLAQVGTLSCGLSGGQALAPVLEALSRHNWLTPEQSASLAAAGRLLQSLQQVERVAINGALDPEATGAELRQVLVRAAGLSSWPDLVETLATEQGRAAATVARMLD